MDTDEKKKLDGSEQHLMVFLECFFCFTFCFAKLPCDQLVGKGQCESRTVNRIFCCTAASVLGRWTKRWACSDPQLWSWALLRDREESVVDGGELQGGAPAPGFLRDWSVLEVFKASPPGQVLSWKLRGGIWSSGWLGTAPGHFERQRTSRLATANLHHRDGCGEISVLPCFS